MSYPSVRSEITSQIQLNLVAMCSDEERGIDTMKATMMLAGILVETLFLFDEPDTALAGSFDRLARLFGTEPQGGEMAPDALPPAHVMDFEFECGRALARTFFEDWLECTYDFHDLLLFVIQQNLAHWAQAGQPVAESFRLFVECARRAMAYEISAQELCDLVIERKIGLDGWTLGDSISGLSALAGRRLALSLGSGRLLPPFSTRDLPDYLDQIAYVMTQEATRLGVPAGSDWRFGLAANDAPVKPPVDLIYGLEPYCRNFFRTIRLTSVDDQAVGCAKAAGRMLALAAGGELPEIEPVIAKPLAMAAMTETYKSVCMERAIISC
ncbi:MAG: hypothetical protein EOM26_05925 [Alphaproteobacteria bacterium]|nr:hypothetical protein [Alphaproteobacteria bacterium]